MGIAVKVETPPCPGVDPWQYQSWDAKAIYGVAHQALECMHQHATPPDPLTYAVWFAYVSKTSDELVHQVDQHISQGETLSRSEILLLYQTYIEDGYSEAARQKLGHELEHNLKTVSKLVNKSASQNRGFGETLKTTAAGLSDVTSADDLQSVVVKISAENDEMARVTGELSQELTDSQAQIAHLNEKLKELQQLNLRDPLTSVSNRRAFDARLKSEIDQAEISALPFCLALVDLDHFKRVNDILGHQAGDEVLKRFAKILEIEAPEDAMVARYGGEEFAIILSPMKLFDAHNLLIHISHRLRQERFFAEHQHDAIGAITASVGLAKFEPGRSPSDLVTIADKQLYAAKAAGRNCVRSEGLG